MQTNYSIHHVILAGLLIITLISIALMGFLLMWSQYSQLDEDIQQLKFDYINSQKQTIQHEVEEAVRYVQYKKSQTNDFIDKKIKAQVEQAIAIAENIYQQNQHDQSDITIKKMILDALRPMRFFDERSYYFIFDKKGNMLLNPLDPQLEGKNIIDWLDIKGKPVIQNMINLIEKQNEGFMSYYWNKMNDFNSEYPKYAFLKLFKPYQWIIGTGEYLDDIEEDVQKEIFTTLSKRRFGKDSQGYLFAFSTNGIIFMHGMQPALVGTLMWDIKDIKGNKFIQLAAKTVKQKPEGHFIQYEWSKSNNIKKIATKILFVKMIPNTNFIIGAGFYLDEIDQIIVQKKQLLLERMQKDIIRTVIILFSLILLVAIFTKNITDRIRDSFDNFLHFFQKAIDQSLAIGPEPLHFVEFKKLAVAANQMLSNLKVAQRELVESERKLLLHIQQTPLAYIEWDIFHKPFQKALRWNPAAEKIFGYSEAEALKANICELIVPKEYYANITHVWQAMLAGKYQMQNINENMTKSGQLITCEWHNTLLKDENNQVIGLVSLGQDITKRQQAEIALRESEEIFRAIGSAAQDAIIMMDDQGNIAYWNNAAERIFGYSKEEAIGRHLHQLIVPQKYQSVYEKGLATFIKTGRGGAIGKTLEASTIHKSGLEFSVEISLSSVNLKGRWSAIGIARDITERKQTETQLADARNQLRDAIESLNVGLVMYDKDERLVICNEKYKEIYAIAAHKIVPGAYYEEILKEFCRITSEMNLNDNLTTKEWIQQRLQSYRNPTVPVEQKVIDRWIMIDDQRTSEGGVVSLRYDITERKQAEEKLKQQNETLVKLNQDKNEFLAIAAHDLKNPLSAILGLAEEIQEAFDEMTKTELLEFAGMIQDSAERMFQLITNLLDVNMIEAGKVNISLKNVNILPILQKVVTDYYKKAQAKQITLQLQELFDINESFIAVVDENTVHQILDNLISNAVKYSPQGKQIYVRICKNADNIRCEIQDEGAGLSKWDQQKLFRKFTRLTTKPTGDEHSTGLGLFIVKKLVEAMNGQVWCESELNQGATFIVKFPTNGDNFIKLGD